jgi:hypothetical protein
LIRNIIADRNIEMIRMITPRTREEVNIKAGGFADDVHVLCGADEESVKGIFRQYERLTKKSGLELNAEKTEILSMHSYVPRVYDVQYCGANIALTTLNEIKICGIWYCNDQDRAYKLNVTDKIEKLDINLKRWKNRNLTFEGKSLIIKTFGLSQLIYNLQVVEIRELCIKKVERINFGYVWIGSRSEKERGIDRIKRAIFKNEYVNGGLKMTDVDCLNRALKLRQCIRANSVDHPIRIIQKYCLEKLGHTSTILQEYHKLTTLDAVVRSAQSTLNMLCDHVRNMVNTHIDEFRGDINAVYLMGTTNISHYLIRKRMLLQNALAAPLRREGIIDLYELCGEDETQMNRNVRIRIDNLKDCFSRNMVELAGAFDPDDNDVSGGMTHYLDHRRTWRELRLVTTKDMQLTLKNIMGKVEVQSFDQRLGIVGFDSTQIGKFRNQCKNIKLRHMYLRLVNRDFYTKERMLRFGMSLTDACERCGEVETYRHLFWDCVESGRVWRSFNEYMMEIGHEHRVNSYEGVFKIDDNRIISMIKVRVIQAMIQIARPVAWGVGRIRGVALELKCIELYNSAIIGKKEATRQNWVNII